MAEKIPMTPRNALVGVGLLASLVPAFVAPGVVVLLTVVAFVRATEGKPIGDVSIMAVGAFLVGTLALLLAILASKALKPAPRAPEVTDAEVDAFKQAWHSAEPGDRVRSGLIAAKGVRRG